MRSLLIIISLWRQCLETSAHIRNKRAWSCMNRGWGNVHQNGLRASEEAEKYGGGRTGELQGELQILSKCHEYLVMGFFVGWVKECGGCWEGEGRPKGNGQCWVRKDHEQGSQMTDKYRKWSKLLIEQSGAEIRLVHLLAEIALREHMQRSEDCVGDFSPAHSLGALGALGGSAQIHFF